MSEDAVVGRVLKHGRLGGVVWPQLPKLPASLTEQSVRGFKSLMIPTQRPAINRDVRAVVVDPAKSNNRNWLVLWKR